MKDSNFMQIFSKLLHLKLDTYSYDDFVQISAFVAPHFYILFKLAKTSLNIPENDHYLPS